MSEGLTGPYDDGNVFARILRGELPCHRIYETDAVLAFLDLFPQSPGHALVIPKQAQARNFLDLDPDVLATLYREAQVVARGIVAELAPEGLQVVQMNGAAGGQTVFHIHVHLIPRWSGNPLEVHAKSQGDPAELAALAERLSKRLGSPDAAAQPANIPSSPRT